MNYGDVLARDARLIILRALSERDNVTLNSTALDAALRQFGIVETREWLFDQLNWLNHMGAIELGAAGSVRVAVLTQKGLEHVQRVRLIEGIGKPSLGSVGASLIAASLREKLGE